MHKKSSKKTRTGLFTFATSNRIKAFVFAVFLVIANLLSLSSAVLVQSAQAKEPSPITINNNLHNTSVPNTGPNAMFTDPSTGVDLINNLKYFATQNAKMVNLVEEVAEQEEVSDKTINGNLNTGLIPVPNSGSPSSGSGSSPASNYSYSSYLPSGMSSSSTIGQIWQAIVGYTGKFFNTSANTGSTTGIAGQVFEGMQSIFYYTIGGGWIPKLGWIVAQYTQEFVSEWIGPTIGNFLIARLIAFKDSPDVSYQPDDFSIQMRNLNHAVRDFSYDLLLLFFILGIWRYWTNSVWGNGNLWGAVGRIVTATAAIIAWPEIYHYTILVANLATDVFIQYLPSPEQLGADVVAFFYNVVAFPATEKTGLMIPFDWILELVLNLAIGLAILVSLIVYFVEKAIQLTIVVMAYVFGPFFLVCIVSPDTERYTSDFLKVFIECTAWNFVWGGLVCLLMYTIQEGMNADSPVWALTSNATLPVTSNPDNPWFVLLLMLGIMQAMLQVPGYISRGGLSAKPGIFELGFAAYQAKRILAGLYGTHGLYTQLRHALRDPNSHRWPLNLPNVNPKAAADYKGQVATGDAFGKKTFTGLGTGSTVSPALAGASAGLLSATSPGQSAALLRAQTSAMTPAQATALSPGQSLLTPSQATALTRGQTGLTPAQTAALGGQAGLTPTQTANLTPAQAAALSQAQAAALASGLRPGQTGATVPGQTISIPGQTISTPGQTVPMGQTTFALGQTTFTPGQTTFTPGSVAAVAPGQAAAMPQAPMAGLPSGLLSNDRSKIPTRAGLPLMDDGNNKIRVTGRQTHTNLAAWLAQQIRLFGDVTFYELDKHPGTGFSKTGITFDQIGGADSFSVPKGASKETRALALAATSFANARLDNGRLDPGFEDAMLMANMHRSMRRGGPFNPWNGTNMLGGVNQKAMDRIALWLSGGRPDDAWKNMMTVRNNRMQNKVIVEGVNAYMHGKSDGKNGIADYWTDKRGDFDAALQVYRLTEPTAKAGGVNQNALEVRDILKAAKIELNGTTQTAAAHPLILALPSTEKPVAIHSMIRLLQSSAVSQYGEEATRMQRPQIQTFYDGVMQHIGEDHVQAASAIARNYGLNYVTPENTNKVVATQRILYNDSLNKDDFSRSAFAAFGRQPDPPSAPYLNHVGKLLW